MNIPLLFTIYFLVVALPVIFWVWFFRRLDKAEPEPRGLLFKVFRYGFLAMLLAAALELYFENSFGPGGTQQYLAAKVFFSNDIFVLTLLSFFLAGPIEELVKYLVLKRLIFRNTEFNQIADGVIYAVTLALGFAFIENTSYFIDIYKELPLNDFLFVAAMRGTATTLLHLVATGICGLYLGRAKFATHNRRWLMLKGLLLASVIHGTYNLMVFFPMGISVNLLMVFFLVIFLVHEIRKEDAQLIHPIKVFK